MEHQFVAQGTALSPHRGASESFGPAREIVEESECGIALYGSDRVRASCNEAFKRLARVQDDVGTLIDDCMNIASPDVPATANAVTLALHNGSACHWEVPVAESSGQQQWIECRLVPLTENGTDRLLLTTVDITERKRRRAEEIRTQRELEHRVERMDRDLSRAQQELAHEVTLRKASEQALGASEERYRKLYEDSMRGEDLHLSLLNSAASAIVVYDLVGRVTYANPAFVRAFGWSLEELLGRRVPFVPESEVESTTECIERVTCGGAPETGFETRRFTKDGRILDISLSAARYHDDKGNTAGFFCIHRDITSHKKAEAQLKKSQKELESRVAERTQELVRVSQSLQETQLLQKAILDNIPDIAWLKDPDGRFIAVNQAFGQACGLAPEDVVGKTDSAVWPSAAADRNRRADLEVMRTQRPKRMEEQFANAEGVTNWVETIRTPILNERDQVIGATGIARDITERKRAEEALRQSEERFRAIFENATDCIFIKDRSLNYLYVNPSMENLFNLRAAEIVNRSDTDLFGEQAGAHLKTVESRVLEGQVVEEEHTRLVQDTPFTFVDTRIPMRDPQGRIVGICGISRNITDKRTRFDRRRKADIESFSPVMRLTLDQALLAAQTDSMVLVTGESGSGKDYLARFIHEKSNRAGGAFYSLNCAAIPSELAESELFGHERGAFTGAHRQKRGLLELAEGGTLVLCEIGELSLHLQAKLLTFLDTRSFTRLGGEKSRTVDARLISTTNADLHREVENRRFRADLFYRLNVFSIEVPPLRDRAEDLPMIAMGLLEQLTRDLQLPMVASIDAEVMEKLCRYAWPGNVRELRNVLERALILSRGSSLNLDVLSLDDRGTDSQAGCGAHSIPFPPSESLNESVKELKRTFICEALEQAGGKRVEAARILGMSRDALKRQMSTLGLMRA